MLFLTTTVHNEKKKEEVTAESCLCGAVKYKHSHKSRKFEKTTLDEESVQTFANTKLKSKKKLKEESNHQNKYMFPHAE